MEFKPRLSEPSLSDPYWVHTSRGGKNQCIMINGGPSVLPNCVGYTWGRFYEISGQVPKLSKGDAGNWFSYTSDGYKRGSTPQLGAVACWAKPGSWGHVAIVEQIHSDGSITTSNSGYNSRRFWLEKGKAPNWINWSGYIFQGFIYNPGCSNLSNKLTSFLSEASKHIGEGPDWTWRTSGMGVGGPWCSAFINAVGKTVGDIIGKIIPDTFSSSTTARSGVANNMGTWIDGPCQGHANAPQPGDLILFRWGGYYEDKYSSDHIGIVKEVRNNKVVTIEGNTGNNSNYASRVNTYTYSISYSCINGYYRPNWGNVGSYITDVITGGNLYDMVNTRNDSILREVCDMNSLYKPSINSSNIKLSVINYTTALGAFFKSSIANSNPSGNNSSGNVIINGVDGAPRQVIEFFTSKGLTPASACGIAGNIEHESGFRTSSVGDNGTSFGICQWHYGRGTAMKNFVGPNWANDLTGQLRYLHHELTTSYNHVWQVLLSCPNNESGCRQSADIFVRKFEIPANVDYQSKIRQEASLKYFKQVVPQL